MQRGDIWWASLRQPTGSEPGYRRPVLIVQSDDFNKSRINTVVVAILTSNLRLQAAPGNVFLTKRTNQTCQGFGGQRIPGCHPGQVIPDGAHQHDFYGQDD